MDPTVSADPCRDSVETSISPSVRDAISLSSFHASVESLLKQWPTTRPRRHKLTSRSETPCGQLRPLRLTTSHETCDVLRPKKRVGEDFAKSRKSRRGYFAERPRAILRTGFDKNNISFVHTGAAGRKTLMHWTNGIDPHGKTLMPGTNGTNLYRKHGGPLYTLTTV